MPKEKRFIRTYSQSASAIEVWVDKQTGVNYLYHSAGYSGGLTVLLDKEGKPVITPIKANKIRKKRICQKTNPFSLFMFQF